MAAIATRVPIPPSALPGISPTRGEIGTTRPPLSSTTMVASLQKVGVARDGASSISPLVGEMPGRAEGGDPDSDETRARMEWRQ